MARTLVAALCCSALVAPAQAQAPATAPRVGVVARVVADGPVEVAALERAIAAQLGDGVQAVVAPVAEARARHDSGAVERRRLAELARARSLAEQGWRAYLAADTAFAEAQLVNARRALEPVLDLDGALELIADVSIRLGAVRLSTGRAAEAEAAFALARALDPERELSTAEFAPALIAAYQQGAGAPPASRAKLRVVAAAGTTVELDGAPVGEAPLLVDTRAGEHVVVARASGRLPAGAIVAVSAEGGEIELVLDPDPAAALLDSGLLAIGAEERAAAAALSLLATWAELDQAVLVVATWRGGEPALLGQRCALEPLGCGPVRELRFPEGGLEKAARELVPRLWPPEQKPLPPILLEDTRATEPERRAGGKPGPAPRAWWKSPWLWAGVGAAALVAGGTVWALSDEPAPIINVQLDPLLP